MQGDYTSNRRPTTNGFGQCVGYNLFNEIDPSKLLLVKPCLSSLPLLGTNLKNYMKEETREQLRKDFQTAFPARIAEVIDDFGSTVKNDLAEWWLNKLESALQEQRQKLMNACLQLKREVHHVSEARNISYNTAIDDIISLINQSK